MVQQDTGALVQLDLDELVRRCRDDIQQYQQHGPPNARSAYVMELFRRAVAMHDENAWESIYDLYRGVVLGWARAYAGADGIVRCAYVEQDAFVNTAFARFSCAFTAKHLEGCTSVSAILHYLKLCTRSAVVDEMRRLQVRRGETSLEAMMEEHGPFAGEHDGQASEIAEQVIGQVWAQDLWQAILEELRCEDDERALLTLLYVQEMKPEQVWRQYPRWFATLDDVIQMQRRIRTRLLKNPRIQTILAADRGDGAAYEQRTVSLSPGIHYHLQKSFCGKQRCRACREGRGHGPYWYSYQFQQGRSIRRYIGKTLPSPLLSGGSSVAVTTRKME